MQACKPSKSRLAFCGPHLTCLSGPALHSPGKQACLCTLSSRLCEACCVLSAGAPSGTSDVATGTTGITSIGLSDCCVLNQAMLGPPTHPQPLSDWRCLLKVHRMPAACAQVRCDQHDLPMWTQIVRYRLGLSGCSRRCLLIGAMKPTQRDACRQVVLALTLEAVQRPLLQVCSQL